MKGKIMVKVYATKININLGDANYEKFLNLVSEENRNRIQKFYFKKDSLRTLYGEIMVRYMMNKEYGIESNSIIIERTSFGKPYIKDLPIQFNISHAGEWVVCAMGSSEIGIDIEQIKDIDYDIAKRFFYKSEYKELVEKSDKDKLCYFYDIWTLKESYIKWLGTGLSTSLDSFYFNITDSDIFLNDENHHRIPRFKQYMIPNYKLSVCSESSSFAKGVKEIDIEKIF